MSDSGTITIVSKRTLLSVLIAGIVGTIVGLMGSALIARRVISHRAGAVPSPALTPEAVQQRYLAAFRTEKRNPGWADPATAAVRSWFATASTRGVLAQLVDVECRAHACVVDLQWKNRETAQGEYGRLLQLSSPAFSGCTTQLLLNPSAAVPYRASLIIAECL